MISKPKILVVGATGYIGKRIIEKASLCFDVYGTSSNEASSYFPMQLSAPSIFDYSLIKPLDVIFLAAAISSPDICANHHDYAWRVNVTGSEEFIEKAISRGGRIVFFSSDTVYGEHENSFDERAACIPAGEYAIMKHEVEKHFDGNPSFKAIRLSYVFSREDKFTKYLIGCSQRNEEAELFHPFFRAVIHRSDVVDGVLALAQRWDEFPQQVFNFGGPDILSRIDFVECLKNTNFPNLKYKVTEPGDDFFKNRPRIIAMKSEILPELLGRPCRALEEAASIEFATH